MYRTYLVLILISLSLPSHAQLGGPSNFDDCVAERLKEYQNPREVVWLVQKACQREFEVPVDPEKISVKWTGRDKSYFGRIKVEVTIDKNTSDFEITKAELEFSEEECANADANSFDIKAIADFTGWAPWAGASPTATVT